MDKTIKIAILLSAIDHMSDKVTRAVEKSEKKIKRIEGINAFGSMALTAGTAAVDFFEKAISAGEESEVAVSRLNTVLSHSVKNYGQVSEAAQKYADKLSGQIAVEDEVIMGVQAKLGIFKRVTTEANMANGVFNRATKAAFDLQAVGLGNASDSIVKIGRLLNNPLRNINSLSRMGVQFDNNEIKQIRHLIQTNKLYEVQDIILKKIEAAGKNAAERMATPMAKLRIALHKVMESIGIHLLPAVNKLANFFANSLIPKIQTLIEQHPTLIKGLGIAAVALLGLGIAAKVVAAAMTLVGVATSPVTWAILAIAALAFVIIRYWEPISIFFYVLWNDIVNKFKITWFFIKKILWDYQPAGLIYNNWGRIKAFFSKLWSGVKSIFIGAWQGIKNAFIALNPLLWLYLHWDEAVVWFHNIGAKFFEAGKNIIRSIGNGIKSMIMWPVHMVEKMVQKIRNFLPFSPAKVGPLKDIHKIKLVETIAASINSKPLISAMRGVTGDVANYRPQAIARTTGGGTVHINYAPTITGGSKTDIAALLKQHSKDLMNQINEEMRKRDRTKF